MSDLRLVKSATATVAFQGVPIFRAQAWALLDAHIHGARATVHSGDRRAGVAERYGKMSQPKLYNCFAARLRTGHCPPDCHGNCLPANQPGHSSHELRGDDTFGRDGQKLAWYELGIDADDEGKTNDCSGLVKMLNHLGYHTKRPYDTPNEKHHFNFTVDPRRNARRHLFPFAAKHPIRWRRLLRQFG